MEAHRLRHMLNRAQRMVDASDAKEDIYAAAGDLVVAIPKRLEMLEQLLDRTSYALSLMGEDFFQSRLPLSERELVDDVIKHSPQVVKPPKKDSLAKRVAYRYMRRRNAREG